MANDSLDTKVQTLTRTANQNVGFSGPGGSVLEGVANLADTALGLFNRSQAQQQLTAAQREQALFNDKVTQGALGLDRTMRALEASNTSTTRTNVEIDRFLNQFSMSERAAILERAKGLSGKSALGFLSDQEKEQLDNTVRVQGLREEAAELSMFNSEVGPDADFNQMGEEELNTFIVDAKQEKARIEARISKQATTQGQMEVAFVQNIGNQLLQNIKQGIRSVDLSDSQAVARSLQELDDTKAQLPLLMQGMLQDSGISISLDQSSQKLQPLMTSLDFLKNELIQGDLSRQGENNLKVLANTLVQGAMSGKNYQDVYPLLLSTAYGVDFGTFGTKIQNIASAALLEHIQNMPSKSTPVVAEELGQELTDLGVPDALVQKLQQAVLNQPMNEQPTEAPRTEEQVNAQVQSVIVDLGGTGGSDAEFNIGNKAALRRIRKLADPAYTASLSSSTRFADIPDSLKVVGDRYVSKMVTAIAGSERATADVDLGVGPFGGMLGTTASFPIKGDVKLNPDFTLSLTGSLSDMHSRQVRDMNLLVQDLRKAYSNLGRDDLKQELEQTLQFYFGESNGESVEE